MPTKTSEELNLVASGENHIFKFPLPTPIYSCKMEVYTQTTKGAMGE